MDRAMHRKLTFALALACLSALTTVASADPLSDDEQEIVYSQIPKQTITLHPRMAELMGWAIGQQEELVVLSGLQDIARL